MTQPEKFKSPLIRGEAYRSQKFKDLTPPRRVLICYQDFIARALKEEFLFTYQPFQGADMYFTESSNIALLSGLGVGAPQLAMKLEELIHWGVEEFISVGSAGAIDPQLQPGDVVLCDLALSGEGTSGYYFSNEVLFKANENRVQEMEQYLTKSKISFVKGSTWSADVPYRLTKEKLSELKKQNIVTMDMEASALYAITKYLDVSSVALFVISDRITEKKWEPCFHYKAVKQNLKKLIKTLLENN